MLESGPSQDTSEAAKEVSSPTDETKTTAMTGTPAPASNEHNPAADTTSAASSRGVPPQVSLANIRGGLAAVVEAVLTATETPMDEHEIATSLGVSPAEVLDAIVELGSDYATSDRGVEVFRVGARWRIGPRGDLVDVAARVIRGECATSLSRAAVETLAVIAYRQPITRSQLTDIRGLDVTSAVRSLVARGLIAESSINPETEETQLSTTADFLEYVQLDSLEDLPPI